MFPTVGKGKARITALEYLCWEKYTVDVARRGLLLRAVQGKTGGGAVPRHLGEGENWFM